jgi:internalin A
MKEHIREKLEKASNNEKKMQLSSGRLKEIPTGIKRFTKLKYLDLFGNSISELPDWFSELNKLKNISLKSNSFSSVPSILYVLNSLENLNLSDNRITEIHDIDIRNLFEINQIDLSFNGFSSFPNTDLEYAKTTTLLLNGNNLDCFPQVLNKIHTLRKLDLSGNSIEQFNDEDFYFLSNLEELDLSNNKLTYLPPSIKQLKKLKKLNLSGNLIKHLPKEFENLTELKSLDLSGNPIENVPVEISAQGPQGIINYYLSLGDNVQLYEAKLLIVGQGNVGKTFLMNRLIKNSAPETKTTEGIDIKAWLINTNSSPDFRVNVWDFGGQEIYHSTHQFFLTKRSLYLLVWEARTDQHLISFDYWLNVIKLLSNDSPIIIVLNKIDERVVSLDERSLKDNFKNIVGFHQVSAYTGKNISDLVSEISNKIDELPLIGDKLPKVWIEIRSELESLQENYITANQYLEICNKHGLSNKRGLFLSQYFHDLGVFLHFQDDSLLKHLVFLKPEWATNAVYKILDSKSVIESAGEFTAEMLESILDEYEGDKQPYIVRLMKKFELCFEIEKDKFLIPELLNPEKKEFDWNYNDNLRFEYHYQFMPAGIMARFIVRTRNMVHDKTFWKNGVILQRENTRALVESDQYSKKIRIWINGENAPFLLEILRKELDDIHTSLNYGNVPEKIPCNCTLCSNSSSPYMFNYAFIKKASSNNAFRTVPCERSLKGINVHNILKLYKIDETVDNDDSRYSLDKILHDLIEISSRVLERKYQKRIEDLINDDVVDLLRTKGHNVSDQTRSGASESGLTTGELDMMIRRDNGIPVTIIESFRLESCGSKNTAVSSHLNKLLSKYDTQGIKRNFMLVFGEAQRFDNLWTNYTQYIKDINSKPDFNDEEYPFSGISIRTDLTDFANIKVCVSRHHHNNETREVVHIMMNMK